MTRTRYKIVETEYPYFMTCTVVGWLPVFTRQETVQILFDSWAFLRANQELQILGYVVLENHLHLIARAPLLIDVMRNFKAWTARKILDHLADRQVRVLLDQFQSRKLAHKTQSNRQFWQEGSHPQQLRTDEAVWQKLEYIHNNPLNRGYVDDPTHWRYSSARNYAGQSGLVDVVTDWR